MSVTVVSLVVNFVIGFLLGTIWVHRGWRWRTLVPVVVVLYLVRLGFRVWVDGR